MGFPLGRRSVDAPRVGEVRRLATEWAAARQIASDLVDDLALVLSELVSNAILHSGGQSIVVELVRRDGYIRVGVFDGTEKRPCLRPPASDSENGRGLYLVEWIARDRGGGWGVSPDGMTTWCCLPLAVGALVPGEQAFCPQLPGAQR
ncbi:ATP-binding protein [Streptomyces sp. P38-E01]|uniref:ATP-binding protein n=1 Tax=Streptomyces tardus TaxID=2780544 RepID=A0A949N8U6_9ACTN|nr:ATP-binding protein [Streptomyces tardus]